VLWPRKVEGFSSRSVRRVHGCPSAWLSAWLSNQVAELNHGPMPQPSRAKDAAEEAVETTQGGVGAGSTSSGAREA
jgi:hypothetical protein